MVGRRNTIEKYQTLHKQLHRTIINPSDLLLAAFPSLNRRHDIRYADNRGTVLLHRFKSETIISFELY
jgi:hypothetical protein